MLFIFVFFVLLANFASSDTSFANLQRIYINGAILDSTKLVDEIYAARDNELIKGVLLDINSPGGAAAASMEIALAIDDLSKKKFYAATLVWEYHCRVEQNKMFQEFVLMFYPETMIWKIKRINRKM